MAIQIINSGLLYGLSSDTKPSTYANNTLFFETDTGSFYKSSSGSWSLVIGASKTETLTNKTLNIRDNPPPYGTMYGGNNVGNKKFGLMHNSASGQLNNWGTLAGVGSTAGTIGGTPPAYTPSNPSYPYPLLTGSVSGNQSKLQWTGSTCWNDGPRFRIQFKLSTTSNIRFFIGWSSVTSSFPTTDTFMATNTQGVGIGKRSTDTVLSIFNNDGQSNFGAQALSPAPTDTAMTSIVTYEMWVDPVADTFNFTHDGGVTVQSFTQAGGFYPTDTTVLGLVIAVGTATGSSRTLTFYSADGENT